jgi:hypothetical protein
MIELRFCSIEFGTDVVWTHFPDGTSCPATPHLTPHYHVIAHRCGYGDDVMAYAREHEFAHAFCEERLHERPSRVLWALAHGSMLSGREAVYEEMIAQVFQRWLRANERPIVSGVDWDGMKRDALALLNG